MFILTDTVTVVLHNHVYKRMQYKKNIKFCVYRNSIIMVFGKIVS